MYPSWYQCPRANQYQYQCLLIASVLIPLSHCLRYQCFIVSTDCTPLPQVATVARLLLVCAAGRLGHLAGGVCVPLCLHPPEETHPPSHTTSGASKVSHIYMCKLGKIRDLTNRIIKLLFLSLE